jgi:hypothetical protein
MKRLPIAGLIVMLAAVAPAMAGPVRYDFVFSGPDYTDGPNNAKAVGRIVFDDTLLLNAASNVYDPTGAYVAYGQHVPGLVIGLTVTVMRSSGGNGTFALDDFNAVVFDTSDWALNLHAELFGQATPSPSGKTWGQTDPIPGSNPTAFYTGNFQLFAKPGTGAPTGFYPFQIGTNEANNDGLQLVSFNYVAPRPIPEPATYLILCLGALGLARKGKNRTTAITGAVPALDSRI